MRCTRYIRENGRPSGLLFLLQAVVALSCARAGDGLAVQANDFVYAWKRILEPTTACEAASLLYENLNNPGNPVFFAFSRKAVTVLRFFLYICTWRE